MSKASNSSLFFYYDNKLVTVKHGDQHRAILRNAEQPLAELSTIDTHTCSLLATDDKGSVLSVQQADEDGQHTYSAYGHDPGLPSSRTQLGFNGEVLLAAPNSYLLGNGYRAYHPALRRFGSPDSWSPFEGGGVNAYAYCSGDPINRIDPSGHVVALVQPASQQLLIPKPKLPAHIFTTQKSPIVRRYEVEHYETASNTVIQTVGTQRNSKTMAVTSTRRTLRTTELIEVVADPHKGPATVHVTRTSLDSYLEASRNLHAAEAANALGDPTFAADPAIINNLQKRREGLVMIGEWLARRAADPSDLTAYDKGTFRVSSGASAVRR
ncbi:RHS repeat-associated core domain-containing protein [Pseudomonas sp. BO3-4]|uniref:RHS repeat-associated core domain-containing protein n=1 Tax=Pseudomonas TaxID=286 RepID=UPI002A5A4DE8|nr:RHS repeat-associated core domain-containing protein [Pseudomonas sp. BO3-4]WPO30365.1 RHS repeat-associated core domain-containing protein [Pseudomonas sp. BO3-4]